jgi:hypothetical protein
VEEFPSQEEVGVHRFQVALEYCYYQEEEEVRLIQMVVEVSQFLVVKEYYYFQEVVEGHLIQVEEEYHFQEEEDRPFLEVVEEFQFQEVLECCYFLEVEVVRLILLEVEVEEDCLINQVVRVFHL